MWRQRRPRPERTEACGIHVCYRTQYEAQDAASWHPATACERCRSGKVWHLWQHGDHWHAGHKSIPALMT